MTEITEVLTRLSAFESAVRRYPHTPVVSIEQGDGGQEYIKVRPSMCFPYEVALTMSLIDGKPHIEVTSGEDGASHLLLDEENGAPLRITVDNGEVYEDDAEWPNLAGWEDSRLQPNHLYRNPDRATISKLWWATIGEIRRSLEVWHADGLGIHRVRVDRYGSKLGGHLDDGTPVEDLEPERCIAALLVEQDEWQILPTRCTSCCTALFQHYATKEITDSNNSVYCVDISAPGPHAGTKHTTNPNATRIVR